MGYKVLQQNSPCVFLGRILNNIKTTTTTQQQQQQQQQQPASLIQLLEQQQLEEEVRLQITTTRYGFT